ncbi:MAG TPA: NAD(P)/FAD-dependent oxidoreductase [Candidatus Dormibacteraeota bacterium]|jgi:pyruvate/2-oxoglutarate dehydrogenase complex dihydrolipoamide dehydrogenase (E3) component|nr:NAD(P)/FAD-dependent oxidoreductase [Candidatus Dormibacteraeota bacterium]
MAERVDVVVLGMGVGGEELAECLAESGLNVVGIESNLVGGECPYYGCVPTKMMIRADDLLAEGRRIPGVAGESKVTPDWGPVARRIRNEATDNWDDRVAVERFEKKGGHFVRGTGKLAGPGKVSVNGTLFEATRGIVIATGTSPAIPPIAGLSEVPYWTNREAVKVEQLPATLAILGGGAIGLELGQAFARFGVKVTIIEGMSRVLAMEEPEASAVLADVLHRDGIELRVNVHAKSVERTSGGVRVNLDDEQQVSAETLLVATGRQANLQDIGLETVGLKPSSGLLHPDDQLRVGERLWAIGDVTANGGFTHVAIYHADIVFNDIMGSPGPGADYRAKPRVTFTDPEVGVAGLTEEQARKQGINVRTGIQKASVTSRGWIHGPGNDGFIKVVEDRDRAVLVGATSMGPRGGDILGIFELAIKNQIPTDDLRHLIYAYPTFYRGVGEAVRKLGGDDVHQPMR